MFEDAKGQAAEACQRAAWQRWGRHYLPSLARAHQLQQCNNFKDPGVQGYGGDVFREVRDLADAAFMKLPPPKPSCLPAARAASAAPVDMRMYYNASGGCIAGGCRAKLFKPPAAECGIGEFQRLQDDLQLVEGDGRVLGAEAAAAAAEAWSRTRRVDLLQAGDVLEDGAGGPAVVQCVVKTLCEGWRARLVEFEGGLRITAWHPVMGPAGWTFPAELAARAEGARLGNESACEAVYSFVLARPRGGSASARPAGMMVDGVECVALAHGIEGDAVASHAFYGTEAVARALREHDPEGWAAGHVTLAADAVVRGPPGPGGAAEPPRVAALPPRPAEPQAPEAAELSGTSDSMPLLAALLEDTTSRSSSL